jgi:hypothetical protein
LANFSGGPTNITLQQSSFRQHRQAGNRPAQGADYDIYRVWRCGDAV